MMSVGWLAFGLLAGPAVSGAQEGVSRATEVRTRNDCRLAAQIVATGHPAPHEAWALELITGCGSQGGAALAAAVRAARQSGDVEALDRLTGSALYIRDAQLFAAALEVAADAGASVPARAFALRAALNAVAPAVWFDDYAALVHPPANGLETCRESYFSHDMASPGDPVPPDAPARLRARVQQLAGDPSVPAEVRAVARCVQQDVSTFAH